MTKDWRNYLIVLLAGASIGGPAGTLLAGVDETRARQIVTEEIQKSGAVSEEKFKRLEGKVDDTNKKVDKLDEKVDEVLNAVRK